MKDLPQEKKPKRRSTDSLSLKSIQDKQQRLKESFQKLNQLQSIEPGYLETDSIDERTFQISQLDICNQIPLSSAQRHFSLSLEDGPYRVDFSPNGRHLLLAGANGHIATFDWKSGQLGCEFYVKERVSDIHYLHNETMFAVAQQHYTYLYDRNGLEIHQLKRHSDVRRLEYLKFHWLLVSANSTGMVRYQDTSTGDLVAEMRSKLGPCHAMTQNLQNAVIHTGHGRGVVALWAPSAAEPLVRMLCHRGPITAIAINRTGQYMVTSGMDGMVKVWDLRNNYQAVNAFRTFKPAQSLSFSQRDLLGVGCGPHATVWKDICTSAAETSPYMYHNSTYGTIEDVQFCPFEDTLVLGTGGGLTSLIVPGAGDPNIDSMHFNPFQSKKQRQEAEVKSLLEKLQPNMIGLDPNCIGEIKDDK